MNYNNFSLVKQNTSYEISFNRRDRVFSPYAPKYKRIRPTSSRSSKDKTTRTGSKIVCAARGNPSVSIEVGESKVTTLQKSHISLSTGNLPKTMDVTRKLELAPNIVNGTDVVTKEIFKRKSPLEQNKSLVPVSLNRNLSKRNSPEDTGKSLSLVSKSLDLRGSPESMRQLRNLIKSMVKTNYDSLKDELDKLYDQNKQLREEVTLHSDTIFKLLEITTEKNEMIAEIKAQNVKLQQEIKKRSETNEHFTTMVRELEALKNKLATSDEQRIKQMVKEYMKSKREERKLRKANNELEKLELSSKKSNRGSSIMLKQGESDSSFSLKSDCSDFLSEIHTIKDSVKSVNSTHVIRRSSERIVGTPFSIKSVSDSMETIPTESHSKGQKILKFFCCNRL